MRIYLFLEDKLLSYNIPVKVYGSFSLGEENEKTENLINIEARDEKWILYSTPDVSVIHNNERVDGAYIHSNCYYTLKKEDKEYLIFITDSFDNSFLTYKYDNNINLVIGNDPSCNINVGIKLIRGVVGKVSFQADAMVLSSVDASYVYLNDNVVETDNDAIVLKNGDQLNIYGFRIIFFKNFLMINNPNNMISINSADAALNQYSFSQEEEPQRVTVNDRDLYSSDDYYSKSPRIRRLIKKFEMELSAPPKVEEDDVTPMILTLGPAITMLLTSLIRIAEQVEKLISGETTFGKSWPTLISCLLMLVSSFVWPNLSKKITAKMKERKRQYTIDKYTKYLSGKQNELMLESKQQADIINDNLLVPAKCSGLINAGTINFWDKRVEQNDFLEVRLGVGNQLLDAEISYKPEDFSIDEDDLRKQADKLIDNFKYIKNVPVGYSFFENKITAIMGPDKKKYGLINNIILQLITFYSYDDVKFVIITNDKNKKKWEFMRYLNHCFSNDKSVRFFSADYEHTRYLSGYLSSIISERINAISNNEGASTTPFAPYYVVITDDYNQLKNTDFIKAITEIDPNLGFSLIILEGRLSQLPSKCNNFINLRGTQSGILKNSFDAQLPETFMDEIDYNVDMMGIARKLANIPIAFNEVNRGLPDSITFLEMERVGKVEQLNILNRWEQSNSVASLKAEVGVDEEGNLMYLDLHEKAHGPHGLIAGTTGSGKSEFIITYILSMAINYSPDEVAFILIDYKGGGLAYAFENKTTGVVLPHLVGTITNLDKAEMNRTLVSIDSEVKRRQKEFNKARDMLGESTIDIYKYQRFYKEGKISTPIPHLFIICDEFAELKSQQPEFMDNLISVARIGRSLGVHLILATQKPSGVVNDQIWSNSKFKVCLKVQDESDSNEMLKRPDAAMLKQAGRYYLQVGMNELFMLGQSGWCGAKYYPSEKIVKQVDKSINFIDDSGVIVKSIQAENSNAKIEAQGEQLGAIMKAIINVSNELGLKAKKLWLPDIEPIIIVDELEKKYNYSQIAYDVEAIIGEFDAPEKQEQGLLIYSFKNNGNTIIYSHEEEERENIISSIIYSACKWHKSSELNIYILDYGSETLRMFNGFPQIGGMTFVGEEEKNKNLFKLISEEIKKRKKILIEYGGSLKAYNEKNEVKLPQIMYIINNIAAVNEAYVDFGDNLVTVARDCERYGINIIITAAAVNNVSYRLSQFFQTRYAIHVQDVSSYDSILNTRIKSKPKDNAGRGYCTINGEAHEFQTASIVKPNEDLVKYLDDTATLLKQSNNLVAPRIPMLPDKVTMDYIEREITNLENIPIGVYRESLKTVKYNFLYNKSTCISSNKLENINSFINSLMEVFLRLPGVALFFVDPNKKVPEIATKTYNNRKIDYFDNSDKYEEVFAKFSIIAKKPEFKKYKIVYILFGIDKIKSIVKQSTLDTLFAEIKASENCTTIICDTGQNIKDMSYDSWYQNVKNASDGIWIGKGFDEQQAFKVSRVTKDMTKPRPLNYGYVVQESSAELVKYIEFTDVIDKEDNEDEK